MKTPQIGDTVTINKPGLFSGCIGEILSDEPSIKNRFTVILNNGGGSWSFSLADIDVSKGKDNSTQAPKSSHAPGIVKDVIEVLKEVGFQEVKQKRKYVRSGKPKEVKIKRAYNRKVK
jgi:hypothetical protein